MFISYIYIIYKQQPFTPNRINQPKKKSRIIYIKYWPYKRIREATTTTTKNHNILSSFGQIEHEMHPYRKPTKKKTNNKCKNRQHKKMIQKMMNETLP